MDLNINLNTLLIYKYYIKILFQILNKLKVFNKLTIYFC